MENLFISLSLVLLTASVLGVIARFFKQPLIVAYIMTGVVISLIPAFRQFDKGFLDLLGNLGIAFLLFLVGVELKIDELKYVGRVAVLTGLGQILFTVAVGFVLVSALGFGTIAAVYIATALTLSSTVIVVKLLGEKNELKSLYGKIIVGFLLVQDFFAILALMFLSGFGAGKIPQISDLAVIVLKGFILIAITYIAARTFLKYLFKLSSVSVELLFVSAIAWAFVMSALAVKFGFSVAIGAFLAGIAIASSPYRIQISARVKPLRDFFVVIFFILLGASVSIGASGVAISHIIILSLFVLIVNPLIFLAVLLPLGFRNRTAFLASVTVAQISEFSLILVTVGRGLNHLSADMVSLVAAVGIVTMTLSSYLILYGDKIYRFVKKPFSAVFPEKGSDPYVINKEFLDEHTILVGAEQIGWDVLELLKKKYKDRNNILVVDFNPEITKTVAASGFNAVFGDIGDPEVLEELELSKAKLIVITDPDVVDSEHLIKFARKKNFRGTIIATAYWIHDAIKLYELGADYVVVPEDVGGRHIAEVLDSNWEHLEKIKKSKSKNFERLFSRKIF